MLVITRKKEESVIIGENIVVTIIEIRGDKVRIGIEAPTEIPIHRKEVWVKIQQQNAESAREDIGGRTERPNT